MFRQDLIHVLESVTDAFILLDPEWRITYVNAAAEHINSASRESLYGRNLWETYPAFVESIVERKLRRAMAERVTVRFEHFYEPSARWFEIDACPLKDGRLAVCGRDITERKLAENTARRAHGELEQRVFQRIEQLPPADTQLVKQISELEQVRERLRRSEAYLAEAQTLTHTGSWAWNVSTGELFWSLEHFRICGLDPETTNPSYPTALQCVHPEDRSFVQQTLEGALQDRSGFHVDCRIVRPDGAIVHIDSFARPVFDDAGEVTEYIGTIVDITERKRAEAALHKAQAELAQFSRVTLMGELVASIAHEINQPLGAIVNNCNVAMRLAELENGSFDKLVEVLSDIASDAIRASAIIEGIREMMKRSTPERTSLRLKDLVDDVLGLAARELAERRIAVRTELAEDMPRVSGDRVQLQQVLLNLVINSIEAMSDVDEETRILSIIAERDNLAGRPAVRLALQDSGIGFQAEQCERIFDAFCTTKRHGMGMGLRISRSIVELHGGRLWAKSDHGQGAAFFLELPTDNEEV
jgi:PAS domain S-box-containing protein